MNFPVTSWLVFIHNQDVGTFSPAFPDLDSAEEFSNAMKVIMNNAAISEPVPLLPNQGIALPGAREFSVS